MQYRLTGSCTKELHVQIIHFAVFALIYAEKGKSSTLNSPPLIQEYLKMLQDTDGLAPFPDPAWMYHDQATHNHHLGVSESQVVDARTGFDLQNRLGGNSSSSSSSSSLHHQQHPLPSHVAPQRQTRSTDDLGGDDGGVAGEPFVGRLISYQEAHHHPHPSTSYQ